MKKTTIRMMMADLLFGASEWYRELGAPYPDKDSAASTPYCRPHHRSQPGAVIRFSSRIGLLR